MSALQLLSPRSESQKSMIDVNNLQKVLGHCGEASVRLTGNSLGYEVIGTFDTCEACCMGKV